MADQAEIPAAVQRLVDATNNADSEAFLDVFAADGVVDDWGREFTGSDAIAGWNSNENIGVQSQGLHDQYLGASDVAMQHQMHRDVDLRY